MHMIATAHVAHCQHSPLDLMLQVGGSVGICGMLALSARTARRADRALTAIHAAEQVLMRSREVRASVGPVFSGGSFQISSEGSGPAAGWYSCTLSGGVRGKVYLEAVPDAASQDKWRVTSLRLELPKAQLAARDAARRSVAEAAGYHGASTASASAGAEAGADSAAAATATAAPAAAAAATAPASGEPAEDELLVWQVVGESQDAASAPAAATR